MSFFSRGWDALRLSACIPALAVLGAGAGTMYAAPALAQDFTNVTASGRVQGTDGKAIAGATIEFQSEAQGFRRSVQTDDSGSFRVPQLPIGSYSVTISAAGYDTYSEQKIVLSQQNSANQFTLAPATASNDSEIVVRAGRVRVNNFDQTTTGVVVNVTDLANRVPVARDLTSIIKLSPGTAGGDSAFGNLASVAGSAVSENAYYLNGLNVTNFRNFLGGNTVPFEFYDTVEVKNGGYSAEFGRATGGVINATTKSGSNEFHAGLVTTWEPQGLHSTSPNTQTADNDNATSSDLRSDFYVSGPIIKNHLFFYGLYESRDVKTGSGTIPTSSTGTGVYTTTKTTSPFFAGKIDAVITDGQRLDFTYFRTTGQSSYNYYTYYPTTNTIGAYNTSRTYRYGGDNFVGRYTGTFTKWLTLSAAYGRSKDQQVLQSSTPDVPYILDYRSGTTGVNNGTGTLLAGTNAVASQTNYQDKREFFRGDVDLAFNLLGSHRIRFGYDQENLSTSALTSYTGGSAYYIYSSATYGDYIIRSTYESGGSFHSRNQAIYLQDSWTLLNDRLTVNLGIRNDRFRNSNANDEVFYKSGDQWGPRLGFTLDVFGDGRSKVYGSFGRYFIPVASNTNLRLAGSEYFVRDYFTYLGQNSDGTPILGSPINNYTACIRTSNTNCRIYATGAVADTSTTVSQTLKPQSVDEYILGGEQRVGDRWRFGVYYTYRNLNRALEDAAIDQAAIAYCNSHGLTCASLYTGFSQYVLINPGSDVTVTLLDGTVATLTADELGYPKAKRTYQAMTFTFDRDFDGRWSLGGSYTLSAGVGNYEGGVKSDIGQADTGLTQDFDQPGLTYGSYGYLPNHHRHNFKIYGSYKINDLFTVGVNGSVLSPRKYGCIGVVPESVDPYAAQYGVAGNYCRYANGTVSDSNAIVLVQRGSAFETDWSSQIDLSLAFTLPTDAFNGRLRFDVFNALNSKAVIKSNEYGGVDDTTLSASNSYKLATGYQTPRYARIQLQLRF